ncbi:MAG TPA: hypothetical protein VIY48_13770 [Candidatus Paceibacterota bacterium]
MASLMLVNPARRKGRRSAAQKAATARMLAANRSRRSSNPRRKRRAHSTTRHSNPIGLHRVIGRKHRRTSRRRNPIGGGLGNIGTMVVNGLKGAGGAIVVNAITSFLPAAITTGKVQYATRAGLAILLGTLGRKALGNNARIMAEGAMVVTMHDLINSFAGSMLPGSQLHGMGAYLSGAPGALPNASGSPIMDSELHGMGEYIYR